jgi:hypothetical protein
MKCFCKASSIQLFYVFQKRQAWEAKGDAHHWLQRCIDSMQYHLGRTTLERVLPAPPGMSFWRQVQIIHNRQPLLQALHEKRGSCHSLRTEGLPPDPSSSLSWPKCYCLKKLRQASRQPPTRVHRKSLQLGQLVPKCHRQVWHGLIFAWEGVRL